MYNFFVLFLLALSLIPVILMESYSIVAKLISVTDPGHVEECFPPKGR